MVYRACVVCCIVFVGAGGTSNASDVGATEAQRIVTATGVTAGLCVHLGVTDGELTVDLADCGNFLVHGLSEDETTVNKLRSFIQSRGNYGRVSVERCDFEQLFYANDLINLLVVDDLPSLLAKGLSLNEVVRVIAPNGTAWVGAREGLTAKTLKARLAEAGIEDFEIVQNRGVWAIIRGRLPAGVDEWTHHCYGPGGNLVSKDIIAGPPQRLRWIAGVPWRMPDYSAKAMVVGGGRIFYVLNEGSLGAKRPWLYLSVRDAYSGVLLWKERWTEIRTPYGSLTMVVSGDRVYMPLNGKLVARNAATGDVIKTYEHGGDNPAAVLLVKDALLITKARTGQLRCVDAETGKLRWVNTNRSILPYGGLPGFAVDGDQIFYKEWRKTSLGCIDLATGAEKWQVDVSDAMGEDKDVRSVLCSHGKGTLIVGCKGGKKGIYAFSDKNGEYLWSHVYMRIGGYTREKAKTFIGGFFIDGLYWTHVGDYIDPDDAKKGREFSWQGLDPVTGKVKKRIDYPEGVVPKASCFRDQATERFFMGGYSDFIETQNGKHHPRARGLHTSCRLGIRAAYGLMYNSALYMPGRFLQGDMATESGETIRDETSRLEKGPAFATRPLRSQPKGDWPCYRHDHLRTNRTNSTLPSKMRSLWTKNLGSRLGQPTVAGGLVFVASVDSHEVIALDAASGKIRWRFTAGGRVRVSPTIHNGRCFFGSNDGWVYCLDAADGQLVWRFRAARADRRIVAHQRVESTWPVGTGVVVANNLACFAAGRHGQVDGGIDVYAVDYLTGEQIWRKPAAEGSIPLLVSDGRVLAMWGKTRFNLQPKNDKLRWVRLPPAAYIHNALAPAYVVLGSQEPKDSIQVQIKNVKVQSIIRAGEKVYVTGKLSTRSTAAKLELVKSDRRVEVFDYPSNHPLEKTESGQHRIWIFPAKGGNSKNEYTLHAAPVFDGMSASSDKLFVACIDGTLCCFGK